MNKEELYEKLKHTSFTKEKIDEIFPIIDEINTLKKEQDAIILVHSYQTPDIMYGIADYIGDSYGLAKIASKTNAKKIIFCSVHFMGETAKLLNPDKEVIVPVVAGCSLAESITAEQVKELKKQHPNAGVVCYVNTSASVKAECDTTCTSANAIKIIEAMPQDEVIFIPDMLMGKNIQKLTKKKLILWDGTCIVHEKFDVSSIEKVRKHKPNAKILAHLECTPAVLDKVDMAGSTNDMMNYVKETDANELMLITECGITDRVKTEFPDKNIVGSCQLCPYMKEVNLNNILKALKNPDKEQIVEIPKEVFEKAKKSLDVMFTLSTD